MKKIALLALTALTFICIGGQTLTAQAAPKVQSKLLPNGKGIVFAYGSNNTNCDVQSILDKLGNCFPNISLPDCNVPETDNPETDAPEVDTPESNLPGTDAPDNNPGNGSTEDSTPEDAPESEHAFIKEVVELVNAERAKEGLSPLSIDKKVQAAAMVRAEECEQRFSHTRPDGTSFATALKEQNVSYKSAGENIAWGQRSPKEVMNAWMNSSGHRANILNPNYTTIGVGYYENANGTDYWCQLFTG